jgi:hypothetical protein
MIERKELRMTMTTIKKKRKVRLDMYWKQWDRTDSGIGRPGHDDRLLTPLNINLDERGSWE